MKKQVFFVFTMTLLTVASNAALAFVRVGNSKISAPQKTIKEAQKNNFGISNEERRIKNEILSLKKGDQKAYEKLVQDSLGHPPEYKSYLLEIRDGLTQIEKAKMIAKNTLFNQIRLNKDFVFQSIVNRHAAPTWAAAEYYIKRDINDSLIYVSKKENDFQFETADWGRVTVAANLKTANWHMDIASRFDLNKPDPSAKDIKVDTDGSSAPLDMDESLPPQEEVPVPNLTQVNKKSIFKPRK